MARKNRWHPVMLPDDYLRKMKQDLSEVEAQVESKTRYEPDPFHIQDCRFQILD
jgi:hypothetical protein